MLRKDVSRDLVPSSPGVYIFKSKGRRYLYIGKAKNIKKRLQQYFTPSSLWKQDMVTKAYEVERLPTKTEEDALILEIQMIKHHLPPYNNLIKSTTGYVYVRLSDDVFPKVSITRYKKNDKAVYIGPKVWKKEMKSLMSMARYVLQRRTCGTGEYVAGVVCSDYHFGQCKGWCAYQKTHTLGEKTYESGGFSPAMTYDEAVNESHQVVKFLKDLFVGRTKKIQNFVMDQLEESIQCEHYEWSAKLRDMVVQLGQVTQQQSIIFDADISGIYCMIDTRKDYRLWVVVCIQEGRVVDVLGHHEHKTDTTYAGLLQQIQREYGYTEPLQQTDDGESWYMLSKKRIKKPDLQLLQDHAQRFLEGYAFSRFTAQDPASRQKLLQTLKDDYALPCLPRRIECLDISHFGGENAVGGLTGMVNGVIAKSLYKRYAIDPSYAGDDYASLKEVLIRRFKNKSENDTYPDLFVIDGGVGQLGVVRSLRVESPARAKRTERVVFVSLGKGEARERKGKEAGAFEVVCQFDVHGEIVSEPLSYSDGDALLISVRDEAHRFANAYRKQIASKQRKR